MDVTEVLTLITHLHISLKICLNGRPVIAYMDDFMDKCSSS